MTAGDKIQSNLDGFKAEVLQVSRDGKRIRIEFWCPVSGKLKRDWQWAAGWSKR
jgi:hypothetical protein